MQMCRVAAAGINGLQDHELVFSPDGLERLWVTRGSRTGDSEYSSRFHFNSDCSSFGVNAFPTCFKFADLMMRSGTWIQDGHTLWDRRARKIFPA